MFVDLTFDFDFSLCFSFSLFVAQIPVRICTLIYIPLPIWDPFRSCFRSFMAALLHIFTDYWRAEPTARELGLGMQLTLTTRTCPLSRTVAFALHRYPLNSTCGPSVPFFFDPPLPPLGHRRSAMCTSFLHTLSTHALAHAPNLSHRNHPSQSSDLPIFDSSLSLSLCILLTPLISPTLSYTYIHTYIPNIHILIPPSPSRPSSSRAPNSFTRPTRPPSAHKNVRRMCIAKPCSPSPYLSIICFALCTAASSLRWLEP
jgi:hypothetical protein